MKLILSKIAHDKINHWVQKASIEVSGFGLVSYDKTTTTFTVVDAFMLEQTGGAAHTDIDAQSLAKLMYRTKDSVGSELKFWWHSHVNMSTFWSGTDLATIKELGGNGWITASVFNKKGDIKSAVCWKTSSELGNSLSINEDVATEVERFVDLEAVKLWDKEFDDNLKKTPPYVSQFNSQGHLKNYSSPKGFDDYSDSDWQGYYRKDFDTKDDKEIDLSKDQNLTTKQKKEKKSFFRKGYFGYGAVLEAKVLNMSPEAYVNKLLFGDSKDYQDIETALIMAEHTGVLV
jgi:proteasome lid subunit RPN8/RPN11